MMYTSEEDPVRIHKPLVKSGGPRIPSPQNRSRNNNLERSSSLSFLAEHNPDIRVLYDEFKQAINDAKDRYSGEAKLLDIFMNLHIFPTSWNQET